MHSIPCAFLTLRLLGADARSGFVGCSKAIVCESAIRLYLGRSRTAWPFGSLPIPVPCSRLSTSEQYCGFRVRTLHGGARRCDQCRACVSEGGRPGPSVLSHLFADGLAGMHYKVNVSIGRVPFLFWLRWSERLMTWGVHADTSHGIAKWKREVSIIGG